MTYLHLPRLSLKTPVFLPDATYGNIKALDSRDLEDCGINAVVMNVFHLMQQPGSSTIRSLGGLHKMSNWKGVIFTDSGGFQAYSLLQSDPKNGSITDKGLLLKTQKMKRHILLTPEKSIQHQLSYGADVLYCLDECTHPDTPVENQKKAVERTIQWAKRCKNEYDKLIQSKGDHSEVPPKIFAVIQGGRSLELRKWCASALLEIGFDGFGYGGWPVEGTGSLMLDTVAFLREIIPINYPLHMLGVGHPKNIEQAVHLGWDIFDSSLPTRDARRGRLFSFSDGDSFMGEGYDLSNFEYLYIVDEKHIKKDRPIFKGCGCYSCLRYSIGYLHHLYKIGDHLYFRLATIHNLFFMSSLCNQLQSDLAKSTTNGIS